MRFILAHGPWWSEWHHLLPLLPASMLLFLGQVRISLTWFWNSRIALTVAAISFVVLGSLIDGISEIGHVASFFLGGVFAGRALAPQRQ